MKTVFLVCVFFYFNTSPVDFKNSPQIKATTVIKEMKDLQECKHYKHQLEILGPPPGAFAAGYYCENGNERNV